MRRVALLACALAWAAGARAEPFPFEEGKVVTFSEAKALRPWLPEPFWAHRQHFFYEGMELEIGAAHRDYTPAPVYVAASDKHAGTATLGTDGALVGYRSGLPFAADSIACTDDPQAGTKLIWNFTYRWQAWGIIARFQYTYWEGGEQRPLLYRGRTWGWFLKHRPEPEFEETDGDMFRNERRAVVVRFEAEEPPEARGLRSLTYRYESSLGPLAEAQPEDTWVFVPDLRRVRKISETQRSTAFAGTDFTFDDLFSFSGVPPRYSWRCLGEAQVLAPTQKKLVGFPYREDARFGPSGFSYASDRWELRRAFRVEMVPKDAEHPYSKKEIWLDAQTFEPLYSFAYDRSGALWKITYHLHRWSGDAAAGVAARDWYPAWEGTPEPRDWRIVSETLVNVQTGTGNRLEFFDSHGGPTPRKDLRRMLDVRSLNRGG